MQSLHRRGVPALTILRVGLPDGQGFRIVATKARKGSNVRILLCLVTVLGGCAIQLEPGAERVRVVTSEEAIEGGRLLDSWSGTWGASATSTLPIAAQNFAHQRGANRVKLTIVPGYPQVSFTAEAWKVP